MSGGAISDPRQGSLASTRSGRGSFGGPHDDLLPFSQRALYDLGEVSVGDSRLKVDGSGRAVGFQDPDASRRALFDELFALRRERLARPVRGLGRLGRLGAPRGALYFLLLRPKAKGGGRDLQDRGLLVYHDPHVGRHAG